MDSFHKNIKPTNLPQHIAVVMDGNGRWAKNKGATRIFGHQNAINAIRAALEGCSELGIKFLTLYTFSMENWARPKSEVEALMELLLVTLEKEKHTLTKNQIRLRIIGDMDRLPASCRENLQTIIETTKNNRRLTLILALSYSGRWEILEAVKNIIKDAKKGFISENTITNTLFSDYLNTSGIPDPELLIRTGGEMRVSNFLLWQIAYTELYITPKLWPDFSKEDMYEAIHTYQKRERRFGKLREHTLKP